MGGRLVVAAAVFGIAVGLLSGAHPVLAQTYGVSSYPYSQDRTLPAATEFDSYEITATVGREIRYSVRATDGGCILVLLILGHNANENSLYLIAYSQETCVESFSRTYRVPTGGGPEFSIVVTSELQGTVQYHVEIDVGEPRSLGPAAAGIGILVLAVVGAIVAGVVYSIKRRKARTPPAVPYPPPYMTYPPPPPPLPHPAAPGPPPATPPESGPPPG